MEERWDENGIYHTRLTDIDLYEVSPCTFPAYTQTSIQARAKESLEKARETLKQKQEEKRKKWRDGMKARLKGESNGT